MTGFAQRYRDEGMQLGRQDGERRVLERLLQRRFGALSAKNTERLTEASKDTHLPFKDTHPYIPFGGESVSNGESCW